MGSQDESKHILIIEDDVSTAQMLEIGLRSYGFTTHLVCDAYSAMNYLKTRIPDIILLDFWVPGDMNGLQLCEKIKTNRFSYIPVIILSAVDDEKTKLVGFKAGADDYISKPFNLKLLVARINSFLHKKEIMEELVVNNRNLTELNSIKDDFLSVCSHDLKNIIMPIMEASSLMRDNIAPDSNLKFSDIIYRQSKKMVNLLEMLLKSTTNNEENNKLNLTEINITQFLQDYLKDCELIQNVEDIEFNLEMIKKIQNWIIDPVKIDEVITNLVSNALKFTPAGGKITFILDGFRKGGLDYLVIGVKDTGEGIAADKLDNIFDKYFTSRSYRKGLDMGLGLSICKTIVQQHEGLIWVESELGNGSTFYFALPKIKQNAASIRKTITSTSIGAN